MKAYKHKYDGPYYTPTPHKLLEKMASSRLNGTDFSVICCIIRIVNGWHKDFDRIAGSQIAKMTGLKREHIVKIIGKLCKLKILFKIKNRSGNYYMINYDTTGWLCSDRKSKGIVYGVSQHTNQKNATRVTDSIPELTHKKNNKNIGKISHSESVGSIVFRRSI